MSFHPSYVPFPSFSKCGPRSIVPTQNSMGTMRVSVFSLQIVCLQCTLFCIHSDFLFFRFGIMLPDSTGCAKFNDPNIGHLSHVSGPISYYELLQQVTNGEAISYRL
ncbi:unnamed protein product [Cuscuta epithymum]|uniref:Uncharacterized protein n=1 Tax=Cuscuta epithymum TaxID=186058 RepID=A0AAV0DI28_9ASTE|nr:unnamed protein product [Cuscuta epithymum]